MNTKAGDVLVFIKTTRAGGREYIKLVESYKEKGVTRHRVLFNFGRADLIKQDESFLRIVKRLCEIAEIPVADADETRQNPTVVDDCSEATLYNYGYLAYLKLWETLGIRGCLEEVQSLTKISYSLPDIVFLMAVQHLLEPRSKLSTYENKHKYFNLPEISLHHMYRALDKLADQKEHIETGLFQYNYIRLNKTVDVVFYDVTTISFESVIADDLRNFGFSKECKFNEVQVVMGMLIDSSGIPVGYELFPGNTFDGKTMVRALENIKKRFGINRVIIVADRGINSKQNLTLIKEAGYEYIVASKIRGMSAKMQEKILAPDGFVSLGNESNAEQGFLYKTIEYENVFTDAENVKHFLDENLVITYSPKRAKKDASDRARLIEKAEKLLKDPEKINALNKRGGKKYLNRANPEKAETWKLDADKIEKDARFDGYYGIQASAKNLSAPEVVDAYSMLWKIEESFRIMKSTLEVQPVFHWNENRIKGHFVVCFLAFLVERNMEHLLANLADEEVSVSPLKIREALTSMQVAAVTTSGQDMLIKTKSTPLSKKIFKKLHIPIPANINSHDNFLELYKDFYEQKPVQLSFL